MEFVRWSLIRIIVKINGAYYYKPRTFASWEIRTSLFDIFSKSSEEYKENFIKYINRSDNRMLEENIDTFEDSFKFYNQFYTTFNRDFKIWKIFKNQNGFNIFYIMFKKSKSLNKYWIKRYMFKRYIESDYLSNENIEKLKNALINFLTNELDINNYILWNKSFIYSDYSDEELDILYKMGLYIKDINLDESIFINNNSFKLIDVVLIKNIWNNYEIKKWNIFVNQTAFDCFLYIYNNQSNLKKYMMRENLLFDFLEKNSIWINSAIRYIDLLIDYMMDLDEIFSTPFYKLLDPLYKFNDQCKINADNIDGKSDNIYSDIELNFLSLFYDIDKIKWYKYITYDYYLDSDYIENDSLVENNWFWLSSQDYSNFYKK